MKQNFETERSNNKTRLKQDRNKNANRHVNKNANNKTKHKPETNYKEKELDRIEPVSRVEALILDDVILTRSRSFDIGHGV